MHGISRVATRVDDKGRAVKKSTEGIGEQLSAETDGTASRLLRLEAMEWRACLEGIVNKRALRQFEDLLNSERESLIGKANKTIQEDATLDSSELSDEIDHASAEYSQSFVFRLRDREKFYLAKIDKALKKIDAGDFGICEGCGEQIALKRLEARPVTSLCIRCKEEQEMEERSYGD